jgi:hypothetical protein
VSGVLKGRGLGWAKLAFLFGVEDLFKIEDEISAPFVILVQSNILLVYFGIA